MCCLSYLKYYSRVYVTHRIIFSECCIVSLVDIRSGGCSVLAGSWGRKFIQNIPVDRRCKQWLKWFCEAEGGGAHLTKPGWSKPHTHSHPTNLALFRHKITLYRFNQGGSYYCRGLKWEQGAELPLAPLTLTTGCKAVTEGKNASMLRRK